MLENILIDYFNLNENDYEEIEWYNAYGLLVQLIYDLEKLGVINNSNEIVDKLDKIDNEVY